MSWLCRCCLPSSLPFFPPSQVLRQGEVVHVTEVWSSSTLEVIFPASTAGAYTFLLTSSGRPVRGAPWTRAVVPAAVEPRLVRPVELGAQTAVVPAGGGFAVRVQLRDAWENHVEATEEHCDQLQVSTCTCTCSVSVSCSCTCTCTFTWTCR